MTRSILLLGCGYVGKAFGHRLLEAGWKVFPIVRSQAAKEALREEGFSSFLFSEKDAPILKNVSHVLCSIPPQEDDQDIGISFLKEMFSSLEWMGYLSSTAVYGDHQGDWVTEESPTYAKSRKGLKRLRAEALWKEFSTKRKCTLLIYRLAGIYGPYRNFLHRIKENKEFREIPSLHHMVSRIHIEDICDFLLKSLFLKEEVSFFNGADNHPSSFEEVFKYAYSLLGEENFEAFLSPAYSIGVEESRRVSNEKMRELLGKPLKFPSFREGLTDIYKKGLF